MKIRLNSIIVFLIIASILVFSFAVIATISTPVYAEGFASGTHCMGGMTAVTDDATGITRCCDTPDCRNTTRVCALTGTVPGVPSCSDYYSGILDGIRKQCPAGYKPNVRDNGESVCVAPVASLGSADPAKSCPSNPTGITGAVQRCHVDGENPDGLDLCADVKSLQCPYGFAPKLHRNVAGKPITVCEVPGASNLWCAADTASVAQLMANASHTIAPGPDGEGRDCSKFRDQKSPQQPTVPLQNEQTFSDGTTSGTHPDTPGGTSLRYQHDPATKSLCIFAADAHKLDALHDNKLISDLKQKFQKARICPL